MSVKAPAPPPLPEQLAEMLRALRLPHIREAAPEVLATAASQRWEAGEVLRVLLEAELAGRAEAAVGIRRRRPGLPAGKTFDAWDAKASSIPAATQQALRTLEWVGRGENVCICRPSGTGKSHFAEALGHLAIDKGKTVAWHTLESLAALLRGARADESVAKAIGKLIRADLVIIDDIGMVPVSPEAAEALFRVVDAAYEKRSLAITSNIHPSGFDEADAEDAGGGDGRPAASPRPRDRHRRDRVLPALPGDRGQGGGAVGMTARATRSQRLRFGLRTSLRRCDRRAQAGETVATGGEKTWPLVM